MWCGAAWGGVGWGPVMGCGVAWGGVWWCELGGVVCRVWCGEVKCIVQKKSDYCTHIRAITNVIANANNSAHNIANMSANLAFVST